MEQYSCVAIAGQNMLETAVHELGHVLGLDHSSNPASVMFAYSKGYNPKFSLHEEDIRRLQVPEPVPMLWECLLHIHLLGCKKLALIICWFCHYKVNEPCTHSY
jgi:hypothetical protein